MFETWAHEACFAPMADLALPASAQVQQSFIEKSVMGLGITQARRINDYLRIKPRLKDSDLDELVARGRLLRVAVQGWAVPGYVHASNKAWLKQAIRDQLQATHTALLSPFDPLIRGRERVKAMFDFDYRLECYTPQAKRQYGYFVLPLQPGVKLDGADLRAVATALQACADWHGRSEVRPTRTSPLALRSALSRLVQPRSFRS